MASLCTLINTLPVSTDLATTHTGRNLADIYSRDVMNGESALYTQALNDVDLSTHAVTSPHALDRRTPPELPKVSYRKRNDPELNLYVVWYTPLSYGVARHWALFLTPAANAQEVRDRAAGTIYQVVDSRRYPHLEGQRLLGKAGAATAYEGAKFLAKVTEAQMRKAYDTNKVTLAEIIQEHNSNMKNIRCSSNCQNWVMMLAESMELTGTKEADFADVPR